MKSLKNFEAPATRGDALGLDYDTLFDGGTYHLVEGDDYDIPAGLTGADLTAARNKIILKIKGKGKRFKKDVKCYKVGAAQKMEQGLVVIAEDATPEQIEKWEEAMTKLRDSWKAKLAAKKAGTGADSTQAANGRAHSAPAPKPVVAKKGR